VELELPLKTRLEPIDARHTGTVALLRGPLVLMAVKRQQDGPLPKVTREQMLAARRVGERQWEINASSERMTMLPFTSLGDQPYSTYLNVT
jgi:DUF1680 family protein